MKKRTFVIGDIHGGHKALLQCLERAKFNYKKDTLISLGDVADGWPDVVECFEELFKIKNFKMVLGNHDSWLLDYLRTEETPDIWIKQGGRNTFKSYQEHPDMKEAHRDFLMSVPYYHIDGENNLYVHGGIDLIGSVHEQSASTLMWSRDLFYDWVDRHDNGSEEEEMYIPVFNHLYVGHTSVSRYSDTPITSGNLTFMDTGGGYEWKLSMMDINTREVFQSDPVAELYPGIIARG